LVHSWSLLQRIASRAVRLAHPLAMHSLGDAEQLARRGGTPGKTGVCDERKFCGMFGIFWRTIEQ
jgi:hypothetical protein